MTLVPRASGLLLAFLLISHALAGLAVMLLPLPLALRTVLLAGVMALLLISIRRRVLMRGKGVVAGLRYRGDEWFLYRDGRWQRVGCRQLTVWSWLVSLEFQLGWRRLPVLLLPDSCDADSLRRLRQMARRLPLQKQ